MALGDHRYNIWSGKFYDLNGKEVGCYTRKYGRIFIDGKEYKLHRYAFFLMQGDWPDGEVDHINGDTKDNRWDNLRVCDRKDNAKNRKTYATNKSGYKGVYSSKHKGAIYWHAKIQNEGKVIYLGTFETAERASLAYELKSMELHQNYRRDV